MGLEELGFSDFFAREEHVSGENGLIPARVIAASNGIYTVKGEFFEVDAQATGKLLFDAETTEALPAVGDWVNIMLVDGGNRGVIHGVLPRKTVLVRKSAGKQTSGQIIAANVDYVFIVQGLDGNFNLRRLERYLIAVESGGAEPVVILSKSDLLTGEEAAEKVREAAEIAQGARVHLVSSITGSGVDTVRDYLKSGMTVCFIGSSGVGKSTLINELAGEDLLATAEVRSKDSKGRHTTSRRSLVLLPSGGMVIDTPGMREFGLWNAAEDVGEAFPEIAEMAPQCRFSDCTHTVEPKCAVKAAVDEGGISEGRYQSYLKLIREANYIAEKKLEGTYKSKERRELRHRKKILKEVYKLKGRQ